MQNAARASVVGNRPYEQYNGQRVANFQPGYDQARGIAAGLQAGGPQSYTAQTVDPTQFNQGPEYDISYYSRTAPSSASPYGASQYQDVNFERGSGYNPTQYNPSEFTRTGDYNFSNYQGGNYGAGQQYSGLGAYANSPGAASYTPREATLREYTQEDIDKYMSPYLSRVVDAQMERANQQFDRDMAVVRLQSARGGGYGDYGSRVTEAILRSDHNRNVNDMVASSLQSGFRDATGLMQSWRDADLQRQGMSQADRQYGAGLNQSDRQFGRTSDLNDAQFAATYGLNRDQELNQRYQSDRQFGAGLDAEQAKFANQQALSRDQYLNQLISDRDKFAADFASGENQFAANLSQQDRQELNRLMLDQRQFGSDFGARERQFASDADFRNTEMLNRMNMNDAQFAAQFDAAERQYGYGMSQDERMQLNNLRSQDRQFYSNLGQQDRQFAAGYGIDARNQFYNQQMGIADAFRRDADTRAQFEQANLDTRYNDFLESRDWDQNQISWLTSILYGTPERVNNNYQNVYQNPLAQGLGAAAALYGIGNGAGG